MRSQKLFGLLGDRPGSQNREFPATVAKAASHGEWQSFLGNAGLIAAAAAAYPVAYEGKNQCRWGPGLALGFGKDVGLRRYG